MFYRITRAGHVLRLLRRSLHAEVMLNCARIGYNP